MSARLEVQHKNAQSQYLSAKVNHRRSKALFLKLRDITTKLLKKKR